MVTPTSSSSSTNASSARVGELGVRLLTLQSMDGHIFEVTQHIAAQSVTIRGMIEEGLANSTIPVINVTGEILTRVVEWLNMHEIGMHADMQELKEWETRFVTINNDKSRLNDLCDLIHAANYLNVPELLDCCCKEVAANIAGKSVTAIREIFYVRNDFTAEEEEQARQENQWNVTPRLP